MITKALAEEIVNLGYSIRKDGIFLGKDGFSKPSYLATDPYSVEVELADGSEHMFRIDQLVSALYMTKPEGTTRLVHKNQLQSDSSVDNLEWK